MPFFDEHIERPLQPRHDRKTRGAIAQHALTRDVLEHILGVAYIVTELRLAEGRDLLMPPAVRRDLVAGRGNAPDDSRVALSDPPEREERARDAALREQIEHDVHAFRHAARHLRPRLARDDGIERADLEVLFHVDGEEVSDWTRA